MSTLSIIYWIFILCISSSLVNVAWCDKNSTCLQSGDLCSLLFLSLESESRSVVSDSLRLHGIYSPWNSAGQNTGVGSLSFLQGIFPTQGLKPDLPRCRQILYQLSHKGSPRTLEWVAYPFSRGSSRRRNWTESSHIAGGFFTNWAIREACEGIKTNINR